MARYITNNSTALIATSLEEAKEEAWKLWSPMSQADVIIYDSLTEETRIKPFIRHGNYWHTRDWYLV